MKFSVLTLLIALLTLTQQACVYRMDIAQGNRIDQQKLDQLATGMTRKQVVFLLGDAAINDRYHANQAHYVYYLLEGKSQKTDLKTMTLTYENDILIDIQGKL